MENKKMIITVLVVILAISAISMSFLLKKPDKGEGIGISNPAAGTYRKISSEEAAEMMKKETGYIITDVRSKEEYKEGHIPGAVSLPLDIIGEGELRELPDKNQKIMVYCRSGNRSRQAALRLIEKGYTDVVDFGGINSWKGEIVK